MCAIEFPSTNLETQILDMLQGETRMKPAAIFERLKGTGIEEKEAKEAIAALISKNAVMFDADWRLLANPAWRMIAA